MRAQVVLVDGDRILLARHERPNGAYWVLPGGAVEEGESPGEAAVREMREETGLEVQVERLLFIDEPRENGLLSIRSPRYTFLGRIVGGEFRQVRDEEDPVRGHLAGAEWLPFEMARFDGATRDTLQRVREALGRL